MLYIKLDEDMCLSITRNEPIYRGDIMNKQIIYLIPIKVGEIDMMTATVYLSYIRADGTADITLLKRLDDKYNERYLQYTLPITATLTRYAGEICTWLQIYAGPPHHPIIAKSSECILQIIASKNMDEYISDRNLSLIYAMQRHMEDKIEKAEKLLREQIEAKADNLIFDEETSTIQLVTTSIVLDEDGNDIIQQTPLGEPIFVRADNAAAIINAEINEDGELIIFFEDETTTNLGKVVGSDGAVYVPHVDNHRVLSFTVETEPGEIPDPVDLNPNDEWGPMGDEWGSVGDNDTMTNYVWEEI